ncbi:MAG: chorismate-binding protein [Alistipes sp.]|nr:chorismate-binding protein [Alistipes sp.]
MKTKITARSKRLLADLQTPVGIYLKVRDMYPQSALLESSDYHSSENSFSFIGIEPLARFSVRDGKITEQYPDGTIEVTAVNGRSVEDALNDFVASFEVTGETGAANGLFGYTSYDAVQYFEEVTVSGTDEQLAGIPEMTYILYRYVVAVNHLRNEMTVTENLTDGAASGLDELLSVIESRNFPTYGFSVRSGVTSPITDREYMEMVEKGIGHCMRGDVFQIVLSRRFEQQYMGDDFMVYRALRSVNPSPYLFYFDFGSFRIFGSSPETHVKVEGNKATIDPIAGTIYRTGDDARDRHLAEQLMADPKENAEHVMLVDLARNDLSRNCSNVRVESYKEIQYYSHVIHMVSRASGDIAPDVNRIRLFADTFPAGTLSGAPKVRAMELIDQIEAHPRGVYGGCIGHIGFDGNLNQAITIRTFVSRNNTLYFQAGAGIVSKSVPENELAEVNNKLGALRRAIEIAGELNDR